MYVTNVSQIPEPILPEIKLRKLNSNLPPINVTIMGLDFAMRNNGVAVWGLDGLSVGVLKVVGDGGEKLHCAELQIKRLIEKIKPDVISIEGYSFNSKFGRKFDLAEIGGIVRLSIYKSNTAAVECPPAVIKKYITGDGRADKKLVKSCLKQLFNIENSNSDENDAIVAALIAHDYFYGANSAIPAFASYVKKNCRTISSGGFFKELKDANTTMKHLGIDYVKDYREIESEISKIKEVINDPIQ
jgi:Holliday junction resolvasome RuvABC endonuclease subunit